MPQVGIHDSLFELGGTSLLAVRLFTQIEKTFGKNFPLATLFQASTAEQLVTLLQQSEWSAPWSSLVAIQPSGSKPSLFCIHGAGGDVLFYYNLVRHWSLEQPVYGLQAQGLNGKQVF